MLLGGPSPTKEEFESGNFFHHEIEKKVLGLFDVAYTDESGLSELVNAASERLEDLDLMVEKKLMQQFFRELFDRSTEIEFIFFQDFIQLFENPNITIFTQRRDSSPADTQ